MRALFLKELKDNRFLFLAVLTVLTAIAVSPGNFGRAWAGISAFLLVPVLCSHFGARMLQAETEDDQLEMLLTLPISRARIWWAKTAAGLVLTLSVIAFAIVVQHVKDRHALRFNESGMFVASVLFLYALSGFFSMVWQRGQGATFSAVGAYVVGLTSITMVREAYGYRVRFSTDSMAALTSCCLVFALVASYYVFTRADLLDAADRRRTAMRAGFVGLASAIAAFMFICLP